ncbi:MAG: DeoR/GlpR transcriptional regulator [Erysipelotrichaceae bacterium]|nr:DeoR/GlpR transcriptional regulator [Erysipelotrichaceae bacterium]
MQERHIRILELLTENKKLEVTELSKLLNVSQVTVRKDLDALVLQGLVKREHGFATLFSSDDINSRLVYHFERKQHIAKKALELIHDGETIMIESGSCCALLAKEILENRKDVTIITNSAFIAEYIRKYPHGNIILLGGQYQKEAQVMVGPLVKTCVQNFFVDKLFIGTDGFTEPSGFTGNDFLRAEAVRDMANQANHILVVTESNKFSHRGLVSLMPTKNIYAVITDGQLPEHYELYLTEQNIQIIKTK